jgi:hypothetical protein
MSMQIHWLSVIVAAVSTFVLGGLWYGPLFGRAWMRASGVTEEVAKSGNPAVTFGIAFVLQFLAAAVFDGFIGPEATLRFGVAAGLAAGLFWVAGGLGVVYAFEHRSPAHWLVNGGYHTVAYAMMGAILGAWS